MKKNLEYYIALLAILCVFLIGLGYLIFTLPHQKKTKLNQDSQTQIKDDFDYVWKFTLSDQLENKFNTENLKGKPALVYFGFTFCPDICPASLGKLTMVIETCRKYGIDLNTVFISIDPERDTPEALKNYLKFFDPSIIGLTGTPEEVKVAADIFKVYYAKDANSAQDAYLVNHSSFVYLIDSQGKLAKIFSLETKPEEIIEFIRLNFR